MISVGEFIHGGLTQLHANLDRQLLVCLTHGMTHFGEIELARTLVGAGAVTPV